jgi:hypothetical protein
MVRLTLLCFTVTARNQYPYTVYMYIQIGLYLHQSQSVLFFSPKKEDGIHRATTVLSLSACDASESYGQNICCCIAWQVNQRSQLILAPHQLGSITCGYVPCHPSALQYNDYTQRLDSKILTARSILCQQVV